MFITFILPATQAQIEGACETAYQRAASTWGHRLELEDTGRLTSEVLRQNVEAVRAAFQCYRASPTVRATGQDREARRLRWLYDELTYLLIEVGRYEELYGVFTTLFQTWDAAVDSALTATFYQRRGFLNLRVGRYAEAVRDYAQAVGYLHSMPTADQARLLLDMGWSLEQVGDRQAALTYYVRTERQLRSAVRTDPTLGSSLGRSLHLKTQALLVAAPANKPLPAAEATGLEADLQEALVLLATPTNTFNQVQAYASLVELLLRQQAPARALPLTGEMLRRASRIQRPSNRLRAQTNAWLYQGRVYQALNDPEAASEAFHQALSLAQRDYELYRQQEALTYLGDVARANGRRAQALTYYEQAITLAEQQREEVAFTDWTAFTYTDWQRPYRSAVDLLLEAGRTQEAFLKLDLARARHLRDLNHASHVLATLSDERRVQYALLNADLQAAHQVLLSDTLRGDAYLAAQTRLAELRAQRRLFFAQTPPTTPRPFTLAELQGTLAARRQVLLTYSLSDRPTLFFVTPTTFLARALPASTAEILAQVRAVNPQWPANGQPVSFTEAAFETAPLRTLHEYLVAPVAEHLAPGTRLLFIPDDGLFTVPFGLLLPHDPGRFQYSDAPFLLRQHPIAYDLAASLIVESARTDHFPRPPHDLLALGRSRFGHDNSPPPGAVRLRATRNGLLPDLPAVVSELGRLRRLFPGAPVELDERAVTSRLVDHGAQAQVIHLASHTAIDPRASLYSAVFLWPEPDRTDGALFLFELQQLNLRAALAVLSGCQTAFGQSMPGEGVLGLHYAFRGAGARSTLATLWFVDDASTARLMERVYVHLQRGLPKDEALQAAQLEYLDSHRDALASPFFWAAPVLYGDPSPIEWNRPYLPPLFWIGVGVVLVGLAVWAGRRWAA